MLEPVAVMPDMPSKNASTGREASPPSRMYGSDAIPATSSQPSATTAKPSRTPTTRALPRSRSSARPSAVPPTSGTRNGSVGSP